MLSIQNGEHDSENTDLSLSVLKHPINLGLVVVTHRHIGRIEEPFFRSRRFFHLPGGCFHWCLKRERTVFEPRIRYRTFELICNTICMLAAPPNIFGILLLQRIKFGVMHPVAKVRLSQKISDPSEQWYLIFCQIEVCDDKHNLPLLESKVCGKNFNEN